MTSATVCDWQDGMYSLPDAFQAILDAPDVPAARERSITGARRWLARLEAAKITPEG